MYLGGHQEEGVWVGGGGGREGNRRGVVQAVKKDFGTEFGG